MTLAWIAATISFGSVVRKANRSFVVSPSYLPDRRPTRPYPGEEIQRAALVEREPSDPTRSFASSHRSGTGLCIITPCPPLYGRAL